MQESQTAQSNTGLIYGLNDRPPVREAIFAAIQHLLAILWPSLLRLLSSLEH